MCIISNDGFQASPRGMNFIITLVVSFHPKFITYVDKAYNIKCFYMEGEESVTSKLEVRLEEKLKFRACFILNISVS